MFGIVRTIIRNKVAVVAVIGLGAFFLMPEGEEEEASTNPWSTQARTTTLASADEGGLIDDMLTDAGDFLDENGINPTEVSEQTVGRLDSAADAYKGANN